MRRRAFLQMTGVGLAGAMLGRLASANASEVCTKKKPNIIFVLVDDLGYGDLGCYGQKKIRTPFLDQMAKDGMRFTDHYTGSTVCAPSRCCLMTGKHTGQAAVRGNREMKPEGQQPMPAGTVTVAKLLKKAGYATGCVGKWGLGGPGSSSAPLNAGFDFFYGYNCQRQAHHFYPPYLWKNGKKVPLPGNANGQRKQYSHDLCTNEAFDFIRENKDKPFFLYMAWTIPHAELLVPEDSVEPYRKQFNEKKAPVRKSGYHYAYTPYPKASYAGMVSRMDRDMGRLFAELKKLGIDENTIVMFASDNGPHAEGQNNPHFFDSNGPFRGIKRDLYEGGIRTPFIVRWPGKVKAGSVNKHISAFWDFLPTSCDLAGIATPSDTNGITLLPTLLGRDDKQKKHPYLYWEFHEQGGKQAVRKGHWKAVRLKVSKNPDAPIELYDLRTDLGEKKNVAAKNPEILAEMAKVMKTARVDSPTFKLYRSKKKK